jgi:cytochrome c
MTIDANDFGSRIGSSIRMGEAALNTGDKPAAIGIGLTILVLALTGTVRAQLRPDPSKGHALAERLCTSCHIVGKEAASGTVSADVPSFAAIANKPNQTVEAIAGHIVIPHPPMPNIQLTRAEIADLATYILALRQP